MLSFERAAAASNEFGMLQHKKVEGCWFPSSPHPSLLAPLPSLSALLLNSNSLPPSFEYGVSFGETGYIYFVALTLKFWSQNDLHSSCKQRHSDLKTCNYSQNKWYLLILTICHWLMIWQKPDSRKRGRFYFTEKFSIFSLFLKTSFWPQDQSFDILWNSVQHLPPPADW